MGRRSKIDTIDLDKVKILAKKGFTDKEMSQFFGVSEVSWNDYKQKHSKFLKALKMGKEESDRKVERSLFERATGYSHPDVHISNYLGKITKTNIIKHYPPEVAACIFWLKNRKRQEWKDRFDNYNHEEIDLPKNVDEMSDKEVLEYFEKLKDRAKT